MNPTGRNFVLGLASLVAVGGLGLLLLFGELDTLVRGQYEVRLDCPNAVGLRSGSNIELNGVPVGHIGEVSNTRDREFRNACDRRAEQQQVELALVELLFLELQDDRLLARVEQVVLVDHRVAFGPDLRTLCSGHRRRARGRLGAGAHQRREHRPGEVATRG